MQSWGDGAEVDRKRDGGLNEDMKKYQLTEDMARDRNTGSVEKYCTREWSRKVRKKSEKV